MTFSLDGPLRTATPGTRHPHETPTMLSRPVRSGADGFGGPRPNRACRRRLLPGLARRRAVHRAASLADPDGYRLACGETAGWVSLAIEVPASDE